MSFDVSTLESYTKQNAEELVIRSLFDAKTQKIIQKGGIIKTGVKSSEAIGRLSTDVQFQSGANCGFNAQGSTAISQRKVTVGKIKVNESFCLEDLEDTYLQESMRTGAAGLEEIPFEETYTDAKVGAISETSEVAIWKGDTTSGDANLNKFDGYIKIIKQVSGSVVHANAAAYLSGAPLGSGTVITGDLAIQIVDAIYKALPAKILGKPDLRIWCGSDFFRTYVVGLKDKNLYHFAPENKELDLVVPGTDIILTGVHGLDGTNQLYGMRTSNMALGTDMMGEQEQFKIWYNEDEELVKFKARFKLGVQVAWPEEIVEFHLGA